MCPIVCVNLLWFRNEYFPSDATLAATQDLRKTTVTTADEADDDDDNDDDEDKEENYEQQYDEQNESKKQAVARKRKKSEVITSHPNKFVKYDKLTASAEDAVGEDGLNGSKMSVTGSENMETSSCAVGKMTGKKEGKTKTASAK